MHERITAQTTTDIIETVNEHRHTTETHTLPTTHATLHSFRLHYGLVRLFVCLFMSSVTNIFYCTHIHFSSV